MPEKGKNTLRFTKYLRQMKAPFVIYGDFESVIEKIDTCIPPTNKSSTTKTEVHKPCGVSFAVVRSDGFLENFFIYRGKDCVQVFLKAFIEEEKRLREKHTKKVPLQMTDEDWRTYHTEKDCHICKKSLMRYNIQTKWSFGDQKQENITEKHTGTQKPQAAIGAVTQSC